MKASLAAPVVMSAAIALAGCGEGESSGVDPGPGAACRALGEELQGALDGAVADTDVPGSVARVTTPTCQWRGAAGAGNIESMTPLQGGELFRLGSVTKTFTAAAVLALVAEGKLSLDDHVNDYVDGVPFGDRMTLRQVLDHTAGLNDYTRYDSFWEAAFAEPEKVWTPQEIIAVATQEPPAFEPGEGWMYSSTGAIIAGVAVESASGMPLADYMRTAVFEPLGLEHTYLDTGGEPPVPGLVHGYSRQEDGSLSDSTSLSHISWAWAAGAGVSSADDLTTFFHGLLGGELLGPAELAEMTAFVPSDEAFFPKCHGYGLSLMSCDDALGPMVGHGGATWGFKAASFHVTARDTMLTVMTNEDSDAVRAIMAALMAELAEP